jgi:hypothetical protein
MTSANLAPNSTPDEQSAPTRRWPGWKIVLIVTLVALLATIIWQYPTWKALAETGTAYGARMGCSCRYIQGRGMNSCRTDAEPGMEIVTLSDVPGERAVTASVPLLASRTARLQGATGCVLDPE